MVTHAGMRLAAASRARALEAGLHQGRDGGFVPLRKMADGHLVNALLRALAECEPPGVTRPLAAEVVRRGLQEYATEVAAERGSGRRTWR